MGTSPHNRNLLERHWGSGLTAIGTFLLLDLLMDLGTLPSLAGAVVAFGGFKLVKTLATEGLVEGDYEDRKA